MATQKAVVILEKGVVKVLDQYPIPPLRPGTVRVRVHAVALNPTDYVHVFDWPATGCLSGCDYAGVVESVFDPPNALRGLKVGDRVCGSTHGANVIRPTDGTFAELIVVAGIACMRIPADLAMADAATLGVASITSGLALYQSLGMPVPDAGPTEGGEPILIYGGSTAMGSSMVQFAKLSGLTVISTCSPRNFDMVRARGADHVLDYNSSAAVAEIRELTNNKLKLVVNCVPGDQSPEFCEACVGDSGGKLCKLAFGADSKRKDIQDCLVFAYSAPGEEIYEFDMHIPAQPAAAEFTAKLSAWAEKLIAEKKIQAHPVDLRTGGFDDVLKGLDELRAGTVSGKKIVVQIRAE